MASPARRPGTTPIDRYADVHGSFRWLVPAQFNLAEVCCRRWARDTPEAVAVHWQHENGDVGSMSYAELQHQADRLAQSLMRHGVTRGDRVAIAMPQRPQTAVSHMAIYQLGGVAVPLSMLFGPEALEYRLNDSGARFAVVDETTIDALLAARPACPSLATVIAVGGATGRGDVDWADALGREDGPFTPVATDADDPALLLYTSGTTGQPKGALIPHRALIGNLPGFVCSQNWFPQDDAVFMDSILWGMTAELAVIAVLWWRFRDKASPFLVAAVFIVAQMPTMGLMSDNAVLERLLAIVGNMPSAVVVLTGFAIGAATSWMGWQGGKRPAVPTAGAMQAA